MTDNLRLTRLTLQTPEETARAVIDDLESLESGLRIFATGIPVPACGTIDHLAVDGRGRPTLLFCCPRLDAAVIARAVDQWSWLEAHLPTLQALGGAGLGDGIDFSGEPRLLIAVAAAPDEALRFAACLSRPTMEVLTVALVSDGERNGLLVEPVPLPSPPVAAETPDPALAAMPAGASRSLMRRMIEELHHVDVAGEPVRALAVEAGVDLVAGERPIGSLRAGHNGVRVRRFEAAAEREVQDDAGCREAVTFLLDTADQERPPQRTDEDDRVMPAPVALTPEEVAEFRRIGTPPRKFVEN